MKQEQRVKENSKQRRVQFRNFAAMTGLGEDVLMQESHAQFSAPASELKASRKRGRLLAYQFLRCFNKVPGHEDSYQVVAWRSLFMPTEILYAMGIMPFTTEMAAAQLALTGLAGGRLETAEGSGFSPDLCSFIKAAAGATLEDVFPTPDIIVTTSHLCDPAAKYAAYTAHRYNRPEFVLDVPYGIWASGRTGSEARIHERAVDYVAGQLMDMVSFITRETGRELDERVLLKHLQWSNEARRWLKQGNEVLLNARHSITTGAKDLNFAANVMQTWGTEEIVDVYRSRYEEFQKAAAHPSAGPVKLKVGWLHLRPYYSSSVLDYIEKDADIVQSQVNHVFSEEMDVRDPFRALARKMLANPGYWPVQAKAELMTSVIPEGHGAVAFYPKSCRHFHASARIEAEMFKKAGIPLLAIDGDCIDNRGDDFLVLKTRIDRFMKKLARHAQNYEESASYQAC
jgi:benzoyl-CoA reductase/2-hydroxyglutaryl-CoA dehydratase subunit BcrC/BadD/HgdB